MQGFVIANHGSTTSFPGNYEGVKVAGKSKQINKKLTLLMTDLKSSALRAAVYNNAFRRTM